MFLDWAENGYLVTILLNLVCLLLKFMCVGHILGCSLLMWLTFRPHCISSLVKDP